MAKPFSLVLGIGFILVGIAGFFIPALLGMHLSTAHSVVQLVTGAISVFFGTVTSPKPARIFCIVLGLVYALFLGVGGFGIGESDSPSAHIPGPPDSYLWQVVPGVLELGTVDHVVHIAIGTLYIIAGIFTRTKPPGYRPYLTK
ncbi:MAG: hypothetical protein ACYC7A_01885 [Thermoanaerobaculia bacterium]